MTEEIKRKILLIIICVLTLLVLVVAIRLNERRIDNELSTSAINKYLTEIKYDDISSYVIEEPSVIIYVSNSSDDKALNFEKKFIPIIKKYNLENNVIYININQLNIEDPFYQNAPELIFYENGSVKDIIDVSALKTKKDIVKILKERSVIGD